MSDNIPYRLTDRRWAALMEALLIGVGQMSAEEDDLDTPPEESRAILAAQAFSVLSHRRFRTTLR